MVSKVDWRKDYKPLLLITAVFLICYYMPVKENLPLPKFLIEALFLVQDYARLHVIMCLVPAMFIAGGIAVFTSKESVMKYLGPGSNKVLAYGVASVSGTILAVCSCTILPLFAGIYRMGAGLGPASAFLYSGPAISVLSILLTARILGFEIGAARAIGAVVLSIIIGLCMALVFRKEEEEKIEAQFANPKTYGGRPLYKTIIFFLLMVAILVFANWGKPFTETGAWHAIYSVKWIIVSLAASLLTLVLISWYGLEWKRMLPVVLLTIIAGIVFPKAPVIAFSVAFIGLSVITSTGKGEQAEWFASSWWLAKQILPLLFIGVLVSGALLGRPQHEGLIPSSIIAKLVGGNSFLSTFAASIVGALWYFATLTEVPILQGLIGSGMGKGPALALLLAGPALSLPSMIVLRSIMGTKKTLVFVCLVVVAATITGMIYGHWF